MKITFLLPLAKISYTKIYNEIVPDQSQGQKCSSEIYVKFISKYTKIKYVLTLI